MREVMKKLAVLPVLSKASPPSSPPVSTAEDTLGAAVELVDRPKLAGDLETAIYEKYAQLLQRLEDNTDAVYNAAMISNPDAFVTLASRSGKVSLTSASAELVHINTDNVPVLVVCRVSNAAEDVYSVRFGAAPANAALAEAQVEFGASITRSLLKPGAALYVTVGATTAPAIGAPVYVVYTVLRLHGRNSILAR